MPQLRGLEGGLEEHADAAGRLEDNLADPRPWRSAPALAADAAELRASYVVARRQLLARLYERAEFVRGKIKQRDGFGRLPADLADAVLRPIQETLPSTTAEAVAPALGDLAAHFEVALVRAETAANDKLDEIRARLDEAHVVPVDPRVRGREVRSREHLREIFDEIEERVGPMLDQGKRVRLL
jgi:hypothetical protein